VAWGPDIHSQSTEVTQLAKPNYKFEKRQRDLAKKKKQEEKRQRKLDRKHEEPKDGPDQPPDEGADSGQGCPLN
jgi:hypothetical protein